MCFCSHVYPVTVLVLLVILSLMPLLLSGPCQAGQTALWCACRGGRAEAVQMMMAAGAMLRPRGQVSLEVWLAGGDVGVAIRVWSGIGPLRTQVTDMITSITPSNPACVIYHQNVHSALCIGFLIVTPHYQLCHSSCNLPIRQHHTCVQLLSPFTSCTALTHY